MEVFRARAFADEGWVDDLTGPAGRAEFERVWSQQRVRQLVARPLRTLRYPETLSLLPFLRKYKPCKDEGEDCPCTFNECGAGGSKSRDPHRLSFDNAGRLTALSTREGHGQNDGDEHGDLKRSNRGPRRGEGRQGN